MFNALNLFSFKEERNSRKEYLGHDSQNSARNIRKTNLMSYWSNRNKVFELYSYYLCAGKDPQKCDERMPSRVPILSLMPPWSTPILHVSSSFGGGYRMIMYVCL